MADKTIKFIKPWGLQAIGAVITTIQSVADLLIQSGKAVEVEKASEEGNPATAPIPAIPPASRKQQARRHS